MHKGGSGRWIFLLFFMPVALWLLLLLVLPHVELLRMSFVSGEFGAGGGVTWDNYLGFFHEPIYWTTFLRTAIYSIAVTLIVLTVSLPIAFYATKIAGAKAQGFLLVLLLLPFWVSELVRVYGWMIILRESGVLSSFMLALGLWKEPVELLYNDAVMIMGLVYTTLLFMIVPVISVLESLDDSSRRFLEQLHRPLGLAGHPTAQPCHTAGSRSASGRAVRFQEEDRDSGRLQGQADNPAVRRRLRPG